MTQPLERDYLEELGDRLREARSARRLTQREVADAAGLSPDVVSRLENGRFQSPGLRTLLRVADGLGTSLVELLPGGPRGPSGPADRARARLHATVAHASTDELELILELARAVLKHGG